MAFFVNTIFLGNALTIMFVYVWGRRNPFIRFYIIIEKCSLIINFEINFTKNRMNFFGLMNFQAPYLPWVLCGFSILLGGSTTVDLMGLLKFDCLQTTSSLC